jgi:cell envelope-related function transcriptional attenuator common domain
MAQEELSRRSRSGKQPKKNKQKKAKKSSKGKKVFLTIMSIFLVLLLAGGVYAYGVFRDAKSTANKFYKPVNDDSGTKDAKKIAEGKPLSILILGTDSRNEDLSGRSDTMIVTTLNAEKKQTTMVSVPRDTYVEGVSLNKINSAYADGGAQKSIEVVDNLLGIKLNNYITMNFEGLEGLVDAVGGVTVNSKLAFSQDGSTFKEGENNLNGKEALAYSRMRKQDSQGDYGRQERQRQVIEGVLKKLKSPKALTAYKDVFKVLGNNVQTDLTWEDMVNLSKNYRSAFDNVKSDNLKGEGQYINNLSYQVVPQSEIDRVHNLLEEQLSE